MTQSRSAQTAASVPTLPGYYNLGTTFLLVPIAMIAPGLPLAGSLPLELVPSASPAATPAAPAPAQPMKEGTSPPPAAPINVSPTPAGAGLPAPLVALLRDVDGPFLANEVFKVAPAEPLAPIEEAVPAPEWYAITRGRFVGVVDQFALSTVAITGVAHGARKAYTTQALALDAFNRALTWGGVQIA